MTVMVLLPLALAGLALLLWWALQRRAGQVRAVRPGAATIEGVPLGSHRTLVQFSSAVCSPCRQAARVFTGALAGADGVVHVELDVAENADQVRRLGVVRTPTTFVLDAAGRTIGRISGVPTPEQAATAGGLR